MAATAHLGDPSVELMQVVAQQLTHDEEVLTAVNCSARHGMELGRPYRRGYGSGFNPRRHTVVQHPHHMHLIMRVVRIEIAQQLDLSEALVDKVLVVADNLDAHLAASLPIGACDRATEDAAAQIVVDSVPAAQSHDHSSRSAGMGRRAAMLQVLARAHAHTGRR